MTPAKFSIERLGRWAGRKGVGGPVATDDIVMEVETDKSAMEVEAGFDGFIGELRAEAGSNVPVGQVIALIVDSADPMPEPSIEKTASKTDKLLRALSDPKSVPAPKPSIEPTEPAPPQAILTQTRSRTRKFSARFAMM